jgi:hypothetical protein
MAKTEMTVDIRGFRSDIRRVSHHFGLNMHAVLRDVHKQWTRDGLQKFPPRTRKIGHARLKSDFGKIFVRIDKMPALRAMHKRLGKTMGEHYFDLTGSSMNRVHQANRNSKGRVRNRKEVYRKFGSMSVVEKVHVHRVPYNRYLRTVAKRIGSLRAGFIPAAVKFGVTRIPQWVSRNARQSGYAVDPTRDAKDPVFITGNRVPWAHRFRPLLRLLGQKRQRELNERAFFVAKRVFDAEARRRRVA